MNFRSLFPLLAAIFVGLGSAWAASIERASLPSVFFSLVAVESTALGVGLVSLRPWARLTEAWYPKWGDLRNGFLVAVFAWAGATLAARTFAGSGAFDANLLRIYLQAGPVGAHPSPAFVVGILAVAALEETVWRWLVPRALEAFVSTRISWVISALLFAVAHIPAAFVMAIQGTPNLLLPGAVLGLALLLGALAAATGRIAPGFVAHVFIDVALLGPFPLFQLGVD